MILRGQEVMEMNLRYLEYFRVLAKTEHVTNAAELLHIPIAVESRLGQGTTFTLHLEQK